LNDDLQDVTLIIRDSAGIVLARKQSPLTAEEVRHLLGRTGFGAPASAIVQYTGLSPEAAADSLISAALAKPFPDRPDWADDPWPGEDVSQEERQQFFEQNAQWTQDFVYDWAAHMAETGLRERLVLFWHNHFVTEIQSYAFAALAYRYIDTLRTHALGNFRELVRAIGLDGAMLIYLNGFGNTATAPNENYARELLELFTMGPENDQGAVNYDEDDIREIARAFTGWIIDGDTWTALFIPALHDTGQKTVFGRTDNFGYDGIVDLLFEERSTEIARFIAAAMIREFVHPDVDPQEAAALADELLEADFSLETAFRALLSSELFYAETTRGSRIKSPAELTIGPFVDRDQPLERDVAIFTVQAMGFTGQRLLNPPNVAGWAGQQSWLNTNTLPLRWLVSEIITVQQADPNSFISLAEMVHDPSETYAVLSLPVALADHLFSIPLDWVEVSSVPEPFNGDLDSNPLPDWFLNGPERNINLAKLFLGNLPWYEWNLYKDGAPDHIALFIRQLIAWPEYQLI